MKKMMYFLKLASLLATSILVLSSCGGGGGSSPLTQTTTATMQAGTVAVGSTEVGTSVQVTSNNAGQSVLTVQNAGGVLVNAQVGQVMAFEANSSMPFGFAGVVQSVQTTSVSGVPTTTASFVPAPIGSVFQNLNLNLSNVGTNPQLMAGIAMQNGVHAYTKTAPKSSNGILGSIKNGLVELNVIASNTNTAVGVDFSGGIKTSFWLVNGKWSNTDPCSQVSQSPCTPVPKVDIVFTGTVELQNPNLSQANIVIQNGKLVTHNLQLQGTLKRSIKATVVGNFNVNASDLAGLFSDSTSAYAENNGYNEYSFDYQGSSIKVHGVEKSPSKIILGAAIISAAGVVPTYGNNQTGNVLKTIPVGMVVTFFMTADMQVQATASLGYQWRDTDINAGMGFSYDDSLGLPVSLLTGNAKPPVPFWNSTPYLNQPEGASYEVSGSASATLTAGIDGGIVLAGLVIAQATVEGGMRGNFSGQLSQPVGGTFSGCYSSAAVTAGVRSILDVAAEVDLKTDFKSNWLKWFNTTLAMGYVYEFPMYPAAGVDWLAETTVWSPGGDTCHNPQFSATAGSVQYSYDFDASATGYQPMVSSYTWDFGDGATATGVTTLHTYANSGTYTSTLTVLFTDGTQKSTSQSITVAALPALSPAFTVSLNGVQASFDASTSTPGAIVTGYSWSYGDGTTGSGITSSHTYSASNIPWSVTLTVTDSYGRTASTSQNVSTTCPSGQVIQNGQCVSPTVPTSSYNLSGVTAHGIQLGGKLIAPVTYGGRTYYYWDVSGDGSPVDYVAHDLLDQMFNGGADTTETPYTNTVTLSNGMTIHLPTEAELSGLLAAKSSGYNGPPGWGSMNANFWTATNYLWSGYHYTCTPVGYCSPESDNLIREVVFEVGADPVSISATATTTAQSLAVGTAMVSFSPLTPGGGVTPYTYSYTGTLPAGLSFDTSIGVLSGTPTATYQTASLIFTVKDANNVVASTTSTVSFTVLSAGYLVQGGLTWMPIKYKDTWTNTNNYCATSTLNGQTGWRMPTRDELKALFASVEWSSSWYPLGWSAGGDTWSSTYYATGNYSDGYGTGYYIVGSSFGSILETGKLTTSNQYVSCVRPVAISAEGTAIAQNLNVGAAMPSFSPLTPSGGATPYTYSYTGTLPAGLSFNTSTGVVTGTPTDITATTVLVFSVMDANSVVASTNSTVGFTVSAALSYLVQGGLTWMPVTFYDAWTNANAYCANTTINGQTGWRLPTQPELSALYASGAMNGQGWTLGDTWSSTVYSAGSHLSVTLNDGIVYWSYDTNVSHFSCVRIVDPSYVVQGGLTWMPVTFIDTWTNANAYCANTTINGQTGWRLPTQPELSALYASGAMNGQGWKLGVTWTTASTARATTTSST